MNNLPIISSYEIKNSRTDQKIPVVNGVHLHSIYNPFKEAEALIGGHLDSLKNKNEVLILGLGFGYHINFAIEKLTEMHGNDFRIIIIDPNSQVYDDCIKYDLLNKKNILVYSGFTAKELYSDLDLIHFLLRKPAMIAHPASFNLYQAYFKEFLTFEAPKNLSDVAIFSNELAIRKYLSTFDQNETFDKAIYEDLEKKSILSKMDFLAMAFVEMTKGTLASLEGSKKE